MIKRSIKNFIASDGQPMVVLIDENGMPLFHPNVYALTKFRTLGRQVSSTEKNLYCIGMAHYWAALNNIDLENTILTTDFLTIEQLQDLAFFLRLKRAKQDELLEQKIKSHTLNSKQIAKKIENIIYMNSQASTENTSTSAAEGAFRIKAIFHYFKFLIHRSKHRFVKERRDDAEQRLNYFFSLAPRVGNTGDQDILEGLSQSEQDTIIEMLKPDNPNNPFRSEFHRHRNQLIYEIFLSTGMRRSELKFLKIEDIDFRTHQIHIRVSKTKERTVKCSSNACEYFHQFITRHLNKVPFKRRPHGYLFTTETGKHLSNDAINLIFRTIQKQVNISTQVTPHTMRRTWNDNLSMLIDSLPLEQRPEKELEKQIRNRLMGWSSISEMSNLYSRRSIREKADELGELLANSIGQNIGENNAK
ncbi:tyrosine-type recombinase/integrase [Acinetobacter sp. WCHAc060042]|uniref:tyrosine-type recombinase/integrase n=1 Tax=Acinetobacter sp. WCHAc060042 TaxID=2213016 RepID=UPI000DA654DC|nr:site-specific integrase [Acinetobacter sp. WCHAc060042]